MTAGGGEIGACRSAPLLPRREREASGGEQVAATAGLARQLMTQ